LSSLNSSTYFVSVAIDTYQQEESKIGVLLSRHPPKIVGVVSECQESRSILTKFANRQTLYPASCNEIIWCYDSANVNFFLAVIDRELLK
jgi:hypothetical protein